MLLKRLRKADEVMEETNQLLKSTRKKINVLCILGGVALLFNAAVTGLNFIDKFKKLGGK